MATQEWSDEITVIDLVNDAELSEELNTIIESVDKTPKDVVINFSQVKFLNSSNISRLLKLRKVVLDHKRRLCLCAIPVQVWGVFLLTGLDSIFEVTEDTATALANLQIKK